jgi:hypothetical protein
VNSFLQDVIRRFITREVALALMVIGAAVFVTAAILFAQIVANCFGRTDFKNKSSGGTLR